MDEETRDLAESFLIDYTPLLCEEQLRKYIKDKTNSILDFDYVTDHYEIFLLSKSGCIKEDKLFDNLGDNLLQAYWQVVVKIAKENGEINECN